jgi:hypothetical protein
MDEIRRIEGGIWAELNLPGLLRIGGTLNKVIIHRRVNDRLRPLTLDDSRIRSFLEYAHEQLNAAHDMENYREIDLWRSVVHHLRERRARNSIAGE